MHRIVEHYDPQKTGFIEVGKLAQFLKDIDEGDADTALVVENLDKANAGKISVAEFIRYWQKEEAAAAPAASAGEAAAHTSAPAAAAAAGDAAAAPAPAAAATAQPEAPSPQPFALFRNTHEAIRKAIEEIRKKINGGVVELVVAKRDWLDLQRAVTV